MINLRYSILKYVMFIVITFYTGMSLAAEDSVNVFVDRSWGLLLGDDVNVKVDLTSLDSALDPSSLPLEDKRYGTWLYLKTIDKTTSDLVFHYQIINVPQKNTMIESPRFEVKQSDGKWIKLPSTSISIGPSLAVGEGLQNITAKPDIKPTLIATDDSVKRLQLFALIAVVSGLILALWHFGWKAKNRQPFAQAVHDLSRLKFHTVTSDQAARILHTAFNHTACTVVAYGELETLLKQRPWLQPLQVEIALFYTQSEQHFFARHSQQGPDIDSVRKLAKACRVKEMLA
ncbi:MAG: mxaA protein [Methylophagaceae bacterium]|jgi:mxaA protein